MILSESSDNIFIEVAAKRIWHISDVIVGFKSRTYSNVYKFSSNFTQKTAKCQSLFSDFLSSSQLFSIKTDLTLTDRHGSTVIYFYSHETIFICPVEM